MGPCLCGDPACGSCFPSGQVAVKCDSCGWTGKTCDLGYTDLEGEHEDPDGCPTCGADVQGVDEPGADYGQ